MKLSILIPTYNRSKDLLKNLNILSKFIENGNYTKQIEIIISNNCSTDSTDEVVSKFKRENNNLNLHYFLQEENIGLENNALFVLDKALGEFVMYLGDDDFIEYEYLNQSINHLTNNPNTFSIIPNYIPIDIYGNQITEGRDDNLPNRLFKKGFKNCVVNSWRGHQLSGLILKRNNLLSAYREHNIGNIYLFIFFVAYSCLKGDTYHFTQFPVKVTQPGQENKDWNYGEDGLLSEVFDNYIKLPLNYFQKSILQIKFYNVQDWRLLRYYSISKKAFFNAFTKILKLKNGTFVFKIVFLILVLIKILKKIAVKK